MEEVKANGCTFYKNKSEAGGAQAHAIKSAPRQSAIIGTITQKMGRMWGYTTPANLLKQLEKNKGIYEIITEFPHKVYFDIDEEAKVDNFQEYIDKAKQTITQYFPNADFAISGSYTESKTSLHIIVNNYFIANEEQRQSMKILCKELNWDWKVYTKNRLMKCINQSKPDGRVQDIIEQQDFKKHLITCFLGASLPFPLMPEVIQEKVMSSTPFDMSLLPKMVLQTEVDYENLTPEKILALLPLNPDFDYNYTHQVARYCYHNKISKDTFIAWVMNKWQDKPFIKKWNDKWASLESYPPVSDAKIKQILSYFYPHLKKDVHYKNFKKTFEIGETTAIETIVPSCFDSKSKYLIFNTGMGSGKTAQTAMYLKKVSRQQTTPNGEDQSHTLWIAPNKALAKNTEFRLQKEGLDVKHYLDFTTKEKHAGILHKQNHLICCLNSLHFITPTYEEKNFEGEKQTIARRYSVVVIDEVETVFDKFLGDFMEKKSEIWKNFVQLLQNAHRVVLLDAFITTKTTKFLEMLDPTHKSTVFVRKFEPQTRTINYMKNYETMVLDIQSKLRDGKKVFIFYPYKKTSSDYASMDQVQKVLESEGKRGVCYNADIDDTVKKGLMNVNESWRDFDFVITNNVITCGVNYEEMDFDYKYLFIASFNTPRDIIQVSYRCRHLNTGIIKVCYLKGQAPDAFLKDTEKIQCPLYTALYNSITVEKMSPLKRSFQLFCTKANYKQDTCNDDFSDALKSKVLKELTDEEIKFPFNSIEDIDSAVAEALKEKTFNQEATMYEKIQLTKYYYVHSIEDTHHKDEMVVNIWKENSLQFLKQVGKMLLDDASVFHKIAKLNKWTFLPSEEVFKKVVFNDEILDQIFTEFKFRTITRTSQPNKILQSVYNLYFKKLLITSTYDGNKHTTYSINGEPNEVIEWAKNALILHHQIGTFNQKERENIMSDEVDEFFEL